MTRWRDGERDGAGVGEASLWGVDLVWARLALVGRLRVMGMRGDISWCERRGWGSGIWEENKTHSPSRLLARFRPRGVLGKHIKGPASSFETRRPPRMSRECLRLK